MRRHLLAALVAAVLAALAPAAHAAAPQCGEVITHSIKLTADVAGCPDSGLVIGADGVTVDLNGHTVGHDASEVDYGSDFGIEAQGHSGLLVRGGRVAGFYAGISLSGQHGRVSGVVTQDNNQGIQILSVPGLLSFDNRVTRTRLDDISNGVFADQAQSVVLDGVTATGGGFRFFEGANNVIRRSSSVYDVLWLGQQGGEIRRLRAGRTYLTESDGTLVFRNTFTDSFTVNQSSNIRVIANQSTAATSAAFTLQLDPEGANNLFLRNIGQRAPFGLVVIRGRGVGVEDNTFGSTSSRSGGRGGNEVGVLVYADTDGIVLRRNNVSHNAGDGIQVAGTVNATLDGNVANFNGGDGFHLDDTASAVLTGNRAAFNGGLGIFAAPSVTDGGGNRANDNAGGDCSPTFAC